MDVLCFVSLFSTYIFGGHSRHDTFRIYIMLDCSRPVMTQDDLSTCDIEYNAGKSSNSCLMRRDLPCVETNKSFYHVKLFLKCKCSITFEHTNQQNTVILDVTCRI